MAELQLTGFAHGGDYNPDQWLDHPEIIERDIELMKQVNCNLMSVGIFAWAHLEPQEGTYNFGWLREIIDKLYSNGIFVLLATPSGARPAWMSQKYPEVLRVANSMRNYHGNRHNHCFSSPVYRSFVTKMNTRLAEEFGAHPAVKGWHVSNEYGGECHCEYCQAEFRKWLKNKYGSLDNLNKAWWTDFWSKTFTDWEQIHSPEPNGEMSLSGLRLAWRRFVSDRTGDFIRMETEPIKRICPDKPVTINSMGFYYPLDYSTYSDVVDFYGYDSYPEWGKGDDYHEALRVAFTFDYVRGFKQKNWSLMECTPSQVNWHEVCKLKKPGLHMLASMQAVAHGSDTVMMFQWRKGRGGPEKFHGAVISHDGTPDTRTFREVSEVGKRLCDIRPVLKTSVKSDVALLFDQDNRWALDICEGPIRNKEYFENLFEHYTALKEQGVNVDVISSEASFTGYKVIAAPYLYMLKDGVAERLEAFVREGGTLLLSYMSGKVDKDDLCFYGTDTFISKVAGVYAEETDALYPDEKNSIIVNGTGYDCSFICDILNLKGADVKGVYGSDFYAGHPALTVNSYGKGKCWYLAARCKNDLLRKLYSDMFKEQGIKLAIENPPSGVIVSARQNDSVRYTFCMNYGKETAVINNVNGVSALNGKVIDGCITLKPFESEIVEVKLV